MALLAYDIDKIAYLVGFWMLMYEAEVFWKSYLPDDHGKTKLNFCVME